MSCCCPPGSWPALKSDYVPKFQEEDVGGYNSYVAGNISERKKVVLLIPDIFGINSGRSKAIADSFESEGFASVIPDLFAGNCVKEEDVSRLGEILPGWAKQYHHAFVKESITKVVTAIKERGATDVYLGGFCWGVWAFFIYLENPDEIVRGAVGYHPSLILEKFVFEGNPAKLAEGVKRPILMLSAGNDPDFVREGGEVIKVLKGLPFGDLCHVRDFPELAHGWVNRGDITQSDVLEGVNAALKDSLDFFAKL